MSDAFGGSIEAVLKLDASQFDQGLKSSQSAIGTFINEVKKLSSVDTKSGIIELNEQIINLKGSLEKISQINSSSLSTFSKLSEAINRMANGLKILQQDSFNAESGLKIMDSVFTNFANTLNTTGIKINGITGKFTELKNTLNQASTGFKQYELGATDVQQASVQMTQSMNMSYSAFEKVNAEAIKSREALVLYRSELMNLALGVQAFNSIETGYTSTLRQNQSALNQVAMADERVAKLKRDLANSTDRATSSIQRQASASNTASASTNRFATATSRLSKALSSLRMMGTMVGSMLAYNFAHHLAQATNETIQSKSEMEGYFKMLNYGQGDINRFNQALDQTVARFQRVNKYSLGETISSIGVEFNLTTDEMIKAMDVTSMITSEYLRAGRNANEASLAVKDVLQGQFQRLSRETGVKGEQLKEAGWSGDVNDVNSLLDALRKVAEDRNWDVFAEKANSLNDIVTILQNRFGEWSADMVNVVQPTIVNAFNAIMTIGSGFADILSGIWKWLNTDGWGQTAVKIGGLLTAILSVTQALTMYRTGMGMVEIANMGVVRSIASVVLGLKGQEIAEVGVRNTIMAKILGVEAEKIAEQGVSNAIYQKIASLQASTAQQQLNTVATGENTTAQTLSTSTTNYLSTAKTLETAEEDLNTASKELNTLATLEQQGANTGLIASLYMLGTGEALVTAETGALSTAWGVLNGVFMLSPIGWLIAGITALAGAIYVLTGGLDSMWGSLQNANSAIEDASSATKPYRDYVEQTNQELEEAKEKYGENSLVVQALSEKYDRAKDSLDSYYEKLQQATSQHSKLNDELGVTSAKMDEIMRAQLGDAGYGEAELDEMTTGIYELSRLQDHDYVAMQKHSAMLGNFSDEVDHFAKIAGNDTKAIQDFGKTYYDFINYSDKANTADNWWDWASNSAMAGLSKRSLNFQELMKGDWSKFYSDEFRSFRESILGDFNIGEWIGDLGDSYNQWADGFGEWVRGGLDSAQETLRGLFDGFFSFEWLNLGGDGGSSPIAKKIDPSWLINQLMGLGDNIDFSWATEYINNNIITPISEAWNNFMADPLGAIGGALMGFGGVGSLLTALMPSDGGVSVGTWVNDTIIVPFSTWLQQGVMSIPLLGDVLSLLSTLIGATPDAQSKGTQIANAFGNILESIVRNIPILSDVLQMLGIIPQANPTASSNGRGVGDAIKQGFKNGLNGIVDIIRNELNHIIEAIGNKIDEAKQRASDLGNAIVSGVRNAIDPGSPGIIARSIIGDEFGTYIPQVISDNGELAYSTAQQYGEQIKSGISSVNTDSLGLDTAVGNYETDAQMIAMSSQMMGMETTTAFNDMSFAVNNTTATMSANVGTTYSQMQQKQTSSLQSMKTQNQTAYNEMYLKSNQSLIQMRDSTSNITQQMVSAWSHMKTQLVATANQLRSESTSHFNRLSDTIGSFYRKIQNPSNWGAGTGSSTPVRSRRNTTVGRSFARGMRTRTSLHGAGTSSTYTGSKYMTIGSLKRKLCPDGSCDYLFNGMDSSERVNVEEFLASITGEHGFGGWSGWDKTHFNYIKNTSDQWSMGSPVIQVMGGIPTNAQFKVGDFENGTPSISFDSFKSMAESIFAPGGIPYKHYMDSSWKGSWLGAIQSGACNCSDGAEAIIAFASACGFGGGQKVHGYWGNEGHFWAVINGEVFDTTAMQKGYGWRSPSVHGYGTKVRTTVSSGDAPSNGNKTVNVTIDMSNSTIYGVDDLDSRIKTGVEEGLKEQFNDPYTVELI